MATNDPIFHPGARVLYTPPDGSTPPTLATVDGVSWAPDRGPLYHILLDGGSPDGQQVAEATLTAAEGA